MENMERKLYEAAMAGSVNTLLELRQQDPLILERPTVNCLSETPLHVAALLGHEDFAKEILPQKPRIAEELDSRKSSALHIASQKGYVGIVKALLQVIPDKCSDTDVDGRNPLHLAAMRGHIDVLEELVRAKPDAASTRLIWVADKQIEAIKFLTTSTAIEVNAVTANGFTAWDILAQSKRDIKDWDTGELLRRAGAISAKDLQLPVNELAVTQTNSVTSHENNQKHEGKKDLKGTPWNLDDWLEKKLNAAMVVASVISTMGFQAAVDPPQSPELAASSFVVWNTIGVDARFRFSSFYDQDLCSINFITTRGSPRKASSPEVPAHTDRSEYAGCFPSANPPTLKSDMKASSESQFSAFFETVWGSDCRVMGKHGILRVTPRFWGKRGVVVL
ncbi:ANK REP REGION domain-containing protein [Citrus sinensis]|nr:ANK REP REGION domain-containing protein [Citrus sinensis]